MPRIIIYFYNIHTMGKKAIYNVILNSVNGTGTYNAQKTYTFDWSVLPRGKYQVHYSYVGKVNNIDGTKLALISLPLGSSKTFTAGSSSGAQTTNFLGALSALVIQVGANSNWRADDSTNPPIYLDDRPYQSTFQVDILDGNGIPFIDATAGVNTSAGSTIAANVLTIAGAGGALNFRAGSVLTGAGVTAGTYIIRSITGTGGNGTYLVTTTPDIVVGVAISGTGTDLNSYNLSLSFDLLEDYNDVQRNSSVYNDSEQVINSSRRNGQYGL